jgi:Ras-related protein Rab-5C
LGDSSVGKSSIIVRYIRESFEPDITNTVGAAFWTKFIDIDQQLVKLHIWDTAGQERYHCLVSMYYRSAHAIIIVYDLTNLDSFNCAKKWLTEINHNFRQTNDSFPTIFLVGNKTDLIEKQSESHQLITKMATIFAKENNLYFFEVSAKTGENIQEMFIELAKNMKNKYPLLTSFNDKKSLTDSINLNFDKDKYLIRCCQ